MAKITRAKVQIIYRIIDRNRLEIGLLLAAILQVVVIKLWFQYNIFNLLFTREYIDELICEPRSIRDESIFLSKELDGDIEIADTLKEKMIVLNAPDYNLIGASEPIDLNPDIKPELTIEAKENEVQGILTIEIIVAADGTVLQVRSVGKNLGYGLEKSAIKTNMRKKFSPSVVDRKAVTVKKLVPVRFKID